MEANAKDLKAASGLPKSVTKRLELDGNKIEAMAAGFDVIVKFPDPVGSTVERWKLADGLRIRRVRVPLGVLAFIYEARPNVTTEAASLALKSGNVIVLRGGSEAINTNKALVKLMCEALSSAGLPADAVQLIEDTSHETAAELMRMRGYVDVLIPRGGAGLIRAVVDNARVPVIETGAGNCHAFVDRSGPRDGREDNNEREALFTLRLQCARARAGPQEHRRQVRAAHLRPPHESGRGGARRREGLRMVPGVRG